MSRTTDLAMLVVVVAATVAAVSTGVAATSPQAAFSPAGDSTHSTDDYTASPVRGGEPAAPSVPGEGAATRTADVSTECHVELVLDDDGDPEIVVYCTVTFEGEQLSGDHDDGNSEHHETVEVRLDADELGSDAVERGVHDSETIARSIATGEGAEAAATDVGIECEFGYDEDRGWYLDCEITVGTASLSGGPGDEAGNGGDAAGDRGERSRGDLGSVESEARQAGSATGTSSPNETVSAREPGVRIECEWVHSEEHGWYLDCEVTVYTSGGDIVILGMNDDDGRVPAEKVRVSVDADGSDVGDAGDAADPTAGDARTTEPVSRTVSPDEHASATATDVTIECEFGYDEEDGWYLDCEITVGTASPSGGQGDGAGNGGDVREIVPSGGENTTVTLAWATGEGDGGNYTATSISDDANDGGNDDGRTRDGAAVGSLPSDGPDGITVTVRNAKGGTVTQTILGGLHGPDDGNDRTPNGFSPAGDAPAGNGTR